MIKVSSMLLFTVLLSTFPFAQESHEHGVPEQLGAVSFPTSCSAAVQPQFERAVALLHSFAYAAAESAFRKIAEEDPRCAMAHWGIAMSYVHQLWDPPIAPSKLEPGHEEMQRAQQMRGGTERERGFINALNLLYATDPNLMYQSRLQSY